MADALTPSGAGVLDSARSVPPTQVEFELAQTWKSAAGAGSDAAIRACMSNLIVYCANAGDLARVGQELPEIVRDHPCRVLVLGGDPRNREAPVEAFVTAIVHVSRGGRRVGSEHVFLRASGSATEGLPAAVRPLITTDLPTALWWTPTDQSPPRYGKLFQSLTALADRVLYDSRGWLNPIDEIVHTASWVGNNRSPQLLTDLVWQRLEPWRRLVAQAMDPQVAPGALEGLDEIVIDYGPHGLPKAWLLVGWLAHLLGWTPEEGTITPGVDIQWTFRGPVGPVRVRGIRLEKGEAELERMSLGGSCSGDRRIETLERLGPERLGITSPLEAPRVLATPLRSRAALLARELPNRSNDPLFRESLALARAMAGAMGRQSSRNGL